MTGKQWDEARAKAARALAAMTDEEDAELTRAAMADPDNPPLMAADFAMMRPANEMSRVSTLTPASDAYACTTGSNEYVASAGASSVSV